LKRTTLALGMIACSFAAACGSAREPLIPVSRYLAANPEEADSSWAKLTVGTRVAVTASDGCAEQVASTPASTSGPPLTKTSWTRPDQLYTVVDAVLLPGEEGHLALTLHGDDGSLDVLRIPHGKSPTCVAPAADQKGSVASWLNKPLKFQPEQAQCRALEISGASARSRLADATPIVVKSLTTAPSRATGKGSPAVWLESTDGLRVRADVAATCFDLAESVAAAPEPKPQAKTEEKAETKPRSRFSVGRSTAAPQAATVELKHEPLGLLHLDVRACRKEATTAGEHIECATPAGLWQGHYGEDQISLHLVKRTVGTLHLVDGVLVAPQGFASNVVALRTATAEDASVDTLQRRMREEAARVLTSDESVRVSESDSDRANLELLVDISDVQVAAVATRTVMIPHEYQDGTKREPNPKKSEARQATEHAKEGIEHAKEECKEKREQAKEDYSNCLQVAKSTSNLANGKTEQTLQAGGEAACAIYKMAMSSNCADEIAAARDKYEAAQQTERNTPDSIDVPVMKKTQYSKKLLSRTVRGRVALSGSLDGNSLPAVAQPFEATVEDFEVEGDAAKKIDAHRASSEWIGDERAAVPAVAPQMAKWVVGQVKSVLGRAAIVRAKAALSRSGEQVAAGSEALHGLALQIGGDRIRAVVHTGTVKVSKAANIPLPKATPSECVLVVATLPEGSAGTLSLAAGDISDQRGKPFANVELCADDDATKVQVASTVEEPVQWATYRVTSFEAPASKDASAGAKAPANANERAATGVAVSPIESISAYARPGAATWITGDIGDASMGDVFTPGPSIGVGAGVRIGSGWFAYGEWERSFVGVGDRSPIFGFREVSSHGDTFLVGGRRTFTGWAIRAGSLGAMPLSPLVDLGLGYSVLRQEGIDVAGDTRTLRLPSATARLLFGVSVRPLRWLAVEPVVGAAAGWIDEIEGEQTVRGNTTAAVGRFESGSVRANLFGGLGIVLDLPLGGPTVPPPAPVPATPATKASAKR
jgi:hypothetical protein